MISSPWFTGFQGFNTPKVSPFLFLKFPLCPISQLFKERPAKIRLLQSPCPSAKYSFFPHLLAPDLCSLWLWMLVREKRGHAKPYFLLPHPYRGTNPSWAHSNVLRNREVNLSLQVDMAFLSCHRLSNFFSILGRVPPCLASFLSQCSRGQLISTTESSLSICTPKNPNPASK